MLTAEDAHRLKRVDHVILTLIFSVRNTSWLGSASFHSTCKVCRELQGYYSVGRMNTGRTVTNMGPHCSNEHSNQSKASLLRGGFDLLRAQSGLAKSFRCTVRE